MSKRMQFWLGIVVSAACVVAVMLVVDLKQVAESLKTADWRAVAFMIAGQLGFLLVRSWRWRLMLPTPAGPVRWSRLFHAQNVGYLVTSLLPFRLGDLARSYLVGLEPGITGLQALSSVVLERVLDMLMIVILFGLASRLAPSLPAGMGSAGMVVSVVVVIGFVGMLLAALWRERTLKLARWGLERLPRVNQDVDGWLARVASLLDGFQILTDWRLLLPVSGLSVLLWLVVLAAYYYGLRGFWPQVTWPAATFTLSAAAFGVAAPSSPGFVGVFHGAVLLGLSVFPASTAQATSFAVVYHAVTTYLVNVGLGLVGLWRSGNSLATILAGVRGMRKA